MYHFYKCIISSICICKLTNGLSKVFCINIYIVTSMLLFLNMVRNSSMSKGEVKVCKVAVEFVQLLRVKLRSSGVNDNSEEGKL